MKFNKKRTLSRPVSILFYQTIRHSSTHTVTLNASVQGKQISIIEIARAEGSGAIGLYIKIKKLMEKLGKDKK